MGGIEDAFVSRAQAASSKKVAFLQDDADEVGIPSLRFSGQGTWMDAGWKEDGSDEPNPAIDDATSSCSSPMEREPEKAGLVWFLFELATSLIIVADCVSLSSRSVENKRNEPNLYTSKQAMERMTNGHMIWDIAVTILLTFEAYVRRRRESRTGDCGHVQRTFLQVDRYITVSSWVAVAMSFNGISFNVRPLRLFRVVDVVFRFLGREPLHNGMEALVMASPDTGAGLCILLAVVIAAGAIALNVLLSTADGRCGLSSQLPMLPFTLCSLSGNSACPEPFECFKSSDEMVKYNNFFGVGLILLGSLASDSVDGQLNSTTKAVPWLVPFTVPFFICFFLFAHFILVNFMRSTVIHAYWRATRMNLQETPACWLRPFEARSAESPWFEQDNADAFSGVQSVPVSMQQSAFRAIHTRRFRIFSDAAVVIYVSLRLARHEGMSTGQSNAFGWAEGVLISWFMAENILVGYAHGFAQHWTDNAWRAVDFGISFVAFASLCAAASPTSHRAFRATSTLGSLRIFKILIRHPTLKAVAERVVMALEGVLGALAVSVTALVAFAIMIRILLGDAFEQVVAGGVMLDEGNRFSFQSVFWAGITLLRLLCPDQAAALVLDTSTAAQHIGGVPCSVAAVCLLLVWFTASYLLLCPLIIAPIMHSFHRPIDIEWNLRKRVLEVSLLARRRVQPLLAYPARKKGSQRRIRPQEDEIETTGRDASPPGQLGTPALPRQAWQDGAHDGSEASPNHRNNGRGRSGGDQTQHNASSFLQVQGGSDVIGEGAGRRLNRGSLRDGSQILKLTPRAKSGFRVGSFAHLRSDIDVDAAMTIIPHPRDGEQDAVVAFAKERKDSAASVSTVDTGLGWGTRAFMMDGLELDQGWVDDISRPTTAEGDERDRIADDAHRSESRGCGGNGVGGAAAASGSGDHQDRQRGHAEHQTIAASATDNDDARSPRVHASTPDASRELSPGTMADASQSGHVNATPTPTQAMRTKSVAQASEETNHASLSAVTEGMRGQSTQALQRQASEVKERGKCVYCNQAVLNTQPRYKAESGSYCHALCHDRPTDEATTDGATRAVCVEESKEPRRARKVVRSFDHERDALSMHKAIRERDHALLHHLIGKGTPLDIPNPKTGESALHVACAWHRLDALSSLIDAGADVEVEDRAGRTPVMTAASTGRLAPILLLIRRSRVDLYHKDHDNRMALQMVPWHSPFTRQALETMCGWGLLAAARKGRAAAVSGFLAHGASAWLSDEDNRTALHLAALHGRKAVVQRLIEHRAPLEAEDVAQKTALELARARNHLEIVGLLAAAGARADEETPADEMLVALDTDSRSRHPTTLTTRARMWRENPRRECRRLCTSVVWRRLVVLNALAGFLPAALYLLPDSNPYLSHPSIPTAAAVLAHSSTALLLLELIVETGAFGLVSNPNSLLWHPAKSTDVAILLLSICHPSFAVACASKALRLVRVIPGLGSRRHSRTMMSGVSNGFQPIMGASILLFALLASFATAGMGLLGGLLSGCSDRSVVYPQGRVECVGHAISSPQFLSPRAWDTTPSSLNDFPLALETVFAAANGEWAAVAVDSMDVTERGRQMKTQHRTEGAVFMSVLVLVATVIGTGVVSSIAANSLRSHSSDGSDPTAAYSLMVMRIQAYASRLATGDRGNRSSQSILEPRAVRFFLEACNAFNVISLAAIHHDSPSAFNNFFTAQNHVCSILLVVEVLLYVTAYGVRATFRFPKHLCTLAALIGAGVDFIGVRETIVIRIVARTLRWILWMSELGRDGSAPFAIATTAIRLSWTRAVPPLGALVVVTCVYAAVGHQAFGTVQAGDEIRDGSDFATFEHSLWTLFHVIAGSQWQYLMHDCTVSPPFCTRESVLGARGDCGHAAFARLFFITFKLVIGLLSAVLLGCVLDGFDKARQVEDETVAARHLIRARQEWRFIEGWGRAGLTADQVKTVILRLPPPLGLNHDDESDESERGIQPCRQAEERRKPEAPKLNLFRGMDPVKARLREMVTTIGIASALRHKGRVTRALPQLQASFPDGRRTPITQLKLAPETEYEDFVLTLIHLAAPALIPASLQPLHDSVIDHARKVEASREIVAFIRRRWEWRANWAGLLQHVHEQAQRKRLRDKLLRDEEEERRRREAERREDEERRKRRREVDEIYDLQGWVARACSLNPHKVLSGSEAADARVRGYFARCVYYEIHIPVGCQTGSPLTPSVNEAIPGYPFHVRSASTFRTVAIPAVPPIPSIPPRKNYTATELCDVLNALVAHDLECLNNANDRRHTRDLQAAWGDMAQTLLRFEVDGRESNGFRVRIAWPGPALGVRGLTAVNSDAGEVRQAKVRLFAAQHSFYAMARRQQDELLRPVGNLAMYLGFFAGNRMHWSPVLGNQNSVVLGGVNRFLDCEIPGGPLSEMVLEHQEDVLASRDYDDATHKSRRRAELIWQLGSRDVPVETASEEQRTFLMNYCGGYGKQRAEVLALQILQAMVRGRLERFRWTTQKMMARKVGEKGVTKVLASKFLAKKERREASLAYMLQMDRSYRENHAAD